MRTADWSDAVSVLDRICAILDAFDEHDGPLGVSELARRANLPKSTVSRVVGELAAHRLLDRDGTTLNLGMRLFEYAQDVELPRHLRFQALPVLSDLRDQTGLSAVVAVPYDGAALVVAAARGTRMPVRCPALGATLPGPVTALGRALADVDAAVGTVFDERGEHDPDVAALACVVRPAESGAAAALAVHGPLDAVHSSAVAGSLRGAARALSARLAAAGRRA
ncbi:helix-turn-helix domain-containing protein [Microbacterium sp. NPDC091313]